MNAAAEVSIKGYLGTQVSPQPSVNTTLAGPRERALVSERQNHVWHFHFLCVFSSSSSLNSRLLFVNVERSLSWYCRQNRKAVGVTLCHWSTSVTCGCAPTCLQWLELCRISSFGLFSQIVTYSWGSCFQCSRMHRSLWGLFVLWVDTYLTRA